MELAGLLRPAPRSSGAPPAPYPPALACLACAAAALGVGTAIGVAGDALLVAPLSLALFGLFLTAQRLLERRRRRAAADAWIAQGRRTPAWSHHAWRFDELTAPRERKLLARSLRHVVDDLSPRRLPGAMPLNRPAVRPHAQRVIAVAERLEALERPVSPAGILRVHRFLTDSGSPLYIPPVFDNGATPSDLVEHELAAVLESLEVR